MYECMNALLTVLITSRCFAFPGATLEERDASPRDVPEALRGTKRGHDLCGRDLYYGGLSRLSQMGG